MAIVVDFTVTGTNVRSDITADPTSDPILEPGLVESEQADESGSNSPAKYGVKASLAFYTGPFPVGSKSMSKGESEKHVRNANN